MLHFKRLRDLVTRLWAPVDDERRRRSVYDLTDGDLRALWRLRRHDEWQALLALADGLATYKAEGLLYENDAIRNAFLRGQIAAIRELPLLVERLAKQQDDAKRTADGSTRDARAADRRDAALYATAGWAGRARRAGDDGVQVGSERT